MCEVSSKTAQPGEQRAWGAHSSLVGNNYCLLQPLRGRARAPAVLSQLHLQPGRSRFGSLYFDLSCGKWESLTLCPLSTTGTPCFPRHPGIAPELLWGWREEKGNSNS